MRMFRKLLGHQFFPIAWGIISVMLAALLALISGHDMSSIALGAVIWSIGSTMHWKIFYGTQLNKSNLRIRELKIMAQRSNDSSEGSQAVIPDITDLVQKLVAQYSAEKEQARQHLEPVAVEKGHADKLFETLVTDMIKIVETQEVFQKDIVNIKSTQRTSSKILNQLVDQTQKLTDASTMDDPSIRKNVDKIQILEKNLNVVENYIGKVGNVLTSIENRLAVQENTRREDASHTALMSQKNSDAGNSAMEQTHIQTPAPDFDEHADIEEMEKSLQAGGDSYPSVPYLDLEEDDVPDGTLIENKRIIKPLNDTVETQAYHTKVSETSNELFDEPEIYTDQQKDNAIEAAEDIITPEAQPKVVLPEVETTKESSISEMQSSRTLNQILEDTDPVTKLQIMLQPIFILPERKPVIFEAYSRLNNENIHERVKDWPHDLAIEEVQNIDTQMCERVLKIANQVTESGRIVDVIYNISLDTLNHENIFDSLIEKIEYSGVDAKRVIIEISQKDFDRIDLNAEARMKKLKENNIRFSLDNITDWSLSLDRLKEIGFSFLKLPAVDFIARAPTPEQADSLHAAFEEYDLDVILDKIESEEILTDIIRLGVKYGQGYHLAPPEYVENK